MKIAIVAFEQFTDLDVFFPWDFLNRVRMVGGIKDWDVKIIGTDDYHTSTAGLKIPIRGRLDELKDSDAVIFSSGIGAQSLINDQKYLSSINLDPHNQLIGSMCSGALILGALGLLTGKSATTYPTVVQQLEQFGVNVLEESFVNEGNISTAAGCLAAQELSSWVIERLVGKKMVDIVTDSVLPLSVSRKIS